MEKTKIAWTDMTFNAWIGCAKVSPGCAHCYAEKRDLWLHAGEHWGRGAPRQRTSQAYWEEPHRWNETNNPQGEPWKVFCASLADWLDDEVPIAWTADLISLIHATPNLIWQLLTKRPENWRTRMEQVSSYWVYTGQHQPSDIEWLDLWLGAGNAAPIPPMNVWMGTSVEDQKRADERIPRLIEIPALIHFLSVEPLLEPVSLPFTCFNGADSFGSMPMINWVIVGGESGNNCRPMEIGWVRQILHDCRKAGVTFFLKQLGGIRDKRGDLDDFPEDLRVREFPK
jgi:protein gp37